MGNEVDVLPDFDAITKNSSSSPSEGMKSRTLGLLKSSGLRPKQPLKVRQWRVIRNRRERARRCRQEQEEDNDSVDAVVHKERHTHAVRVTFTEPELVHYPFIEIELEQE